jgi:biopolymer transport protein ExbD
MAFGLQDSASDNDSEVMSEINMTPLVDVMLVLLIIFIITVPVMKHAVLLDLPKASSQVQNAKPETISLSIDAQGQYYWNQTRLADGVLGAMLAEQSQKSPQPELHIRADKAVRYEYVAQAMAAAQQAGLKKIGFVTEPAK